VFDENNNAENKISTIFLSPSWIAGSQITWAAFDNFHASLLSKYVGKQYLDNTQDERVALDDYFIHDLRLSYRFTPKRFKAIELGALINNLFNVKYSSNGYGYGGVPYFYPQAGVNFLAMLSVKI
jgi:iron complex outermembrane receptor protein